MVLTAIRPQGRKALADSLVGKRTLYLLEGARQLQESSGALSAYFGRQALATASDQPGLLPRDVTLCQSCGKYLSAEDFRRAILKGKSRQSIRRLKRKKRGDATKGAGTSLPTAEITVTCSYCDFTNVRSCGSQAGAQRMLDLGRKSGELARRN